MRLTLIFLVLLASSAFAFDVTVNTPNGAKHYTAQGMTADQNGNLTIDATGGASSSSSSTSSSSSSSSSVIDGCGAWPSGVDRYAYWDLTNPGSQVELPVKQNTLSFGFESIDDSSFYGTFGFSSAPTWSEVRRDVWISECPEATPSNPVCAASGYSAFSIKWSNSSRRGYSCRLEAGKQYYMNVKNTECPGSNTCGLNRNFYQ